ncbi:hypothetical protein BAE44_0020892 [Dichanthelium oligosanthes]|uniref:Protein kinase domain-containing protein n=1 Tax=Dichanthelium oligosanthes TaxID=888268 RepID=A0A1E5UYW8_9POAL|nr:hypothetical protein BAE44_0020892 [Dichanthelium oligosanthes]
MATNASGGLLGTLMQELPLEFLNEITNGFSDDRKISEGAFGTVYKEQTRINTINVVGAKGYMAPEYLYSGEISPQCDIYSLGVLILEITTREKNCINDKDMAARNFIIDIRETWTDGHIASKYSSLDADCLQQVKACIEIAFKCVDVAQRSRPSIVDVVDRLYGRRAG